jgi:Fur family ferric uptake transcriptional regulator
MATSRELQAALKTHGLRMTPQRQLILSAIASLQGHISADTVHQQVVERFPNVNISTVYRTLELLQELGLVTHTHFDDGVAQYHLAEESSHQHLVCRECGSEQELDLALLRPLAAQLTERYGFEPDLAHFAIVGRCARCADRAPLGLVPSRSFDA